MNSKLLSSATDTIVRSTICGPNLNYFAKKNSYRHQPSFGPSLMYGLATQTSIDFVTFIDSNTQVQL